MSHAYDHQPACLASILHHENRATKYLEGQLERDGEFTTLPGEIYKHDWDVEFVLVDVDL